MPPPHRKRRPNPRPPESLGQTAEQLLLDVRRGQSGAWARLVTQFERLVLAVPKRLELDDADCEDVAQTTWMLLHQNLATIKRADALPKWLVTTAYRQALRQRDLRQTAAIPEEDREDESLPHPAQVLTEIEERQLLERGIAALDEPCRLLITALWQETPYAQIRDELGIPLGSIGPKRKRCLERLLQLLEQMGLE